MKKGKGEGFTIDAAGRVKRRNVNEIKP